MWKPFFNLIQVSSYLMEQNLSTFSINQMNVWKILFSQNSIRRVGINRIFTNNSDIVCAKQGMILVRQHNMVIDVREREHRSPILLLIFSGSTLIKCGNCHQKLGQTHKEFIQSAATSFMQPLKSFLDGEMKTLAVTRSLLVSFDRMIKEILFFSRKNDEL